MSLNTNPIYSGIGQVSWTTALTASNTSYDMTTGISASVFTASPSGSYLQRIRFKPSGSTSGSAARIFINNGNTTVATNNVLFDEISLPAVVSSTTAATPVFELPMNLPLPANYTVYVTLTTAQTPAGGWYAAAVGGSYLTP